MTYTIKTKLAEAYGKQQSAVVFNDIFFNDWISEFIHVSAQNARNIDAIALWKTIVPFKLLTQKRTKQNKL